MPYPKNNFLTSYQLHQDDELLVLGNLPRPHAREFALASVLDSVSSEVRSCGKCPCMVHLGKVFDNIDFLLEEEIMAKNGRDRNPEIQSLLTTIGLCTKRFSFFGILASLTIGCSFLLQQRSCFDKAKREKKKKRSLQSMHNVEQAFCCSIRRFCRLGAPSSQQQEAQET